MNRSSNIFGQLTKIILAMSAFSFAFAMTEIDENQVVAQSATVEIQPNRSSRRSDADDRAPTEDTSVEDDLEDEIQLDASDEMDDSDDDNKDLDPDRSLDEEDKEEDPDDMDDDLDDLDDMDDDLDDLDDDVDDVDDTDEPKVGSMPINTDTRFLRVNITETNAEAPTDQSDELVSRYLGTASILPSEKIFAWAAPDISYQPLYFEDVAHERYGQTPEGCELRQTVLSAAHFFGSAALLPYKLVDQHRHSCDGPLGFCRPGSDSPFVRQKLIVR